MAFIAPIIAGVGLTTSTALGLGAGLVGAVGSVAAGQASQAAQAYNAQVLEIQAKTAQDQAAAVSANTVDATRRKVGTAIASGIEGGADFGGSFRDVVSNIDTEGHLDALNAIYKGGVQATGYRNQAAADIYQGNVANTAGWIGAGTSLLKGVSAAYKGGSLDI